MFDGHCQENLPDTLRSVFPHHTKRGLDVVDFPTGKEKRLAEVVEAIRKLYVGKPASEM